MKQRGFTLIEVLVALGIMAFIIGATHQILDVTTRTQEASEETLDELARLQTVFRVLEQDFSQISKRSVRNNAGDISNQYLMHERYLFDSEYDGIGFVRNGWTNPAAILPRSELQAVAYRVQEGKLQRLYRLYVDQLDGIEPRTQDLISDVEEFKFEFLGDDENKLKWETQWQKETLPRAIAVELTLKDEDPIRRLFLLAGSGEQNAEQDAGNQQAQGAGNAQG